jgi:hypothetical protein
MNQPVFVTVGDAVVLTRPLESFSGVGALPVGLCGFVHRLTDPVPCFALVEFVDPNGDEVATVYVDTRALRVVESAEGEPLRQALADALYLVGQKEFENRQLRAAAPRLAPPRLAGRPQVEQVSFEHVTDELAAALKANGYAKVSNNDAGEPEVWARLRVNGHKG